LRIIQYRSCRRKIDSADAHDANDTEPRFFFHARSPLGHPREIGAFSRVNASLFNPLPIEDFPGSPRDTIYERRGFPLAVFLFRADAYL